MHGHSCEFVSQSAHLQAKFAAQIQAMSDVDKAFRMLTKVRKKSILLRPAKKLLWQLFCVAPFVTVFISNTKTASDGQSKQASHALFIVSLGIDLLIRRRADLHRSKRESLR